MHSSRMGSAFFLGTPGKARSFLVIGLRAGVFFDAGLVFLSLMPGAGVGPAGATPPGSTTVAPGAAPAHFWLLLQLCLLPLLAKVVAHAVALRHNGTPGQLRPLAAVAVAPVSLSSSFGHWRRPVGSTLSLRDLHDWLSLPRG